MAQIHSFSSLVAQLARLFAMGWTARVRSRGIGGGRDFSSLLRDQTGPGIHSASYKISSGGFSQGKSGRA